MAAAALLPSRRVTARRLWLLLAAAIVLVAAAAAAAHAIVMSAGLARLREAAGHRLDMIATGIDAQLARFEVLPSLLEMTPIVQQLLAAPADAQLKEEADRYLASVNATAGAEMLYVLDRSGTAIAAADAHQPGTPVGRDLSFRPYVQEALTQRRGRFYGVGVTSGLPGYYLSFALSQGGQVQGIATVKVSLADAERAWRQLPGEVLLADARGVVILATEERWRYRPLAPLGAAERAEIARTQPYGDAALQPLDWHELGERDADGRIVRLEGIDQLASLRTINGGQWQLITLDRIAPARSAARTAAAAAGLGALVVMLLGLAAWQRRRAIQHKLASRAALQAAHDSLESKVAERTAALQAAQAELVHAEKMAALGQLSAGLVHELNQPLAAMRTLSDNAGVLLDHRRLDDVRGNLQRIGKLVDRLGRLTRQLKIFARKDEAPPAGPPPVVCVASALAEAEAIVGPRLQEAGATLAVQVKPPGLAAAGDAPRLEQVLVNLLGNAIDATMRAVEREVHVQAGVRDGRCVIEVSDSGPGIAAQMLPRLFQPFATSKPSGAGLCLGLMISAHLVRECGGTLRGENRAAGGACFTIELPLAKTSVEEIHDA